MADDGRADSVHDRRYLAMVLPATFASLRWGLVTALRRTDVDLEAGTVRIRATYIERATGELLLGRPSRNFNRMSGLPYAVRSIGSRGLHFHDLRHTGNTSATASGAKLRDLMARMGHDSERAAMICQHESDGADQAITDAIDRHVQAGRTTKAQRACSPQWTNRTLMAQKINDSEKRRRPRPGNPSLTWT